MELDFSPVIAGWPDIMHGALVTVEVTAASLALSCVLGLLIGIWLPWLAALASAGLALVMLGAVSTHLRIREPLQKIALPIVMGALAVVVAVSYWPMLLHLVVRL